MNFIIKGSTAVLRALAVTALVGLTIGLSGCGGQTGDRGPAGSIGAAQATGTIQGHLRDAVTQEPIVGALIDIGVNSATTNAQGEFAMYNVIVPVDANNQPKATMFYASINLKNITSPVTTTTSHYPNFTYTTIPVSFTTLYVDGASGVTATPVTGLVATANITQGKLAATISGVVLDSVNMQSVGAGYTVNLESSVDGSNNSASANGGTGATGNIVATATTDANGAFTFANIESLRAFNIKAFNATQTMTGIKAVTAPADGQTTILSASSQASTNNGPVLVSTLGTPKVTQVTPLLNADLAVGTVDVVYSFNKPVKQTPYTATSAASKSSPYSLLNTISVNRTGAKASNIPFTAAWNATFDQLTVSVDASAAASYYSVALPDTWPAVGGVKVFTDVSNVAVTSIPATWTFTTFGATMPAAPTATTLVVPAPGFNAGTTTATLNWTPMPGAKGYNVYRRTNIAGTGATGMFELVNPLVPADTGVRIPITVNTLTDTMPLLAGSTYPLVQGANQVTNDYQVKSVSMDNTESLLAGPMVTVIDTVPPTVTGAFASGVYTLTFSEPVTSATALLTGNYSVVVTAGSPVGSVTPTGISILSVSYVSPTSVTVRTNIPATTAINSLRVSGVLDIKGNTVANTDLPY